MKWTTNECRTLADLQMQLQTVQAPVILVEGIRKLPPSDWNLVAAMGAKLATDWPQAMFRTGNAPGTDTAFAQGIASVDAHRLEYVLPSPSMGRSRRQPQTTSHVCTEFACVAEGGLDAATWQATPNARSLVAYYRQKGGESSLGVKALYLLRDTLKVIGAPAEGLAPAHAGIFYVNLDDPLSGGTGHTIRVCMQQHIPVITQITWRSWV